MFFQLQHTHTHLQRILNCWWLCLSFAFYSVTVSLSKSFVEIISSSCSMLLPSPTATMKLTYKLTKQRPLPLLCLLRTLVSCLHLGIWRCSEWDHLFICSLWLGHRHSECLQPVSRQWQWKKTLLSFLLYNYFGYGYMKPVILICNGIQKCGARPFYGTQRDKVLGTEYSYYKPCSCTSTNFIMLWKTDTEIQFLNRTHRGSPSTTGGMRTIFWKSLLDIDPIKQFNNDDLAY